MSRFSGDLSMVDHSFSHNLDNYIHISFHQVILLIVIMVLIPEMIIVVVPSMMLYFISVVAVDRTNREARRQANLALSPIMTNVSETDAARTLITAMGFGPFFCKRQTRNINRWVQVNHFSDSVLNWGFMLYTYIGLLFTIASLLFVYMRNYKDIGKIGISLNYCILIPYFLSLNGYTLMLLGNGATCLERLLQYGSDFLPQELAWKLPSDPPSSD